MWNEDTSRSYQLFVPRNSTSIFAVELMNIKFRQRALNWDEATDSSHPHPICLLNANSSSRSCISMPDPHRSFREVTCESRSALRKDLVKIILLLSQPASGKSMTYHDTPSTPVRRRLGWSGGHLIYLKMKVNSAQLKISNDRTYVAYTAFLFISQLSTASITR